MTNKNNEAWKEIFQKYPIVEEISKNNFFKISSTQINNYREARLMTKFDHIGQIPGIYKKHRLSILSISRNEYIIGPFEAYYYFNDSEIPVEFIEFPTMFETLNPTNITSEATALNCAYNSGILSDFTQDPKLCPTVSGRMGSSSFNFFINVFEQPCLRVQVNESQIEIDGGFEGGESLYLFEAKNFLASNFLIRQLYYPFRLWKSKIKKKVRPIFQTYSNGIFHLREYAFEDPLNYNSLILINEKKYSFHEGVFNIETLQNLLNVTPRVNDAPDIPFPQADKFERVINLCEILKQKKFMSKDEITSKYEFASRQSDYYANAARYLGLIKRENHPVLRQPGYSLTEIGEQIFNNNLLDRQIELTKLIISHDIFKAILEQHLDTGEMPETEIIIFTIRRFRLGEETNITLNRRASTVKGWINWIIGNLKD